MAITAMQRRINATTGVNRQSVNRKTQTQRRRATKNLYRRKSNGGNGG